MGVESEKAITYYFGRLVEKEDMVDTGGNV
jgi:hypothetical protein